MTRASTTAKCANCGATSTTATCRECGAIVPGMTMSIYDLGSGGTDIALGWLEQCKGDLAKVTAEVERLRGALEQSVRNHAEDTAAAMVVRREAFEEAVQLWDDTPDDAEFSRRLRALATRLTDEPHSG